MKMVDRIPKITVLLATFNGVKFLDQQLNSLAGQQGVRVEVHANDDGSTDGTVDLLENWKERGLIKTISQSNQIGSSQAFLNLLKLCNEKSFVAFCDQDDIWEARKLITQVRQLKSDKPTAVTSRRIYIDDQSNVVGVSPKLRFNPCFENALVENSAPGNTMLINNKSIQLINNFKLSDINHYDSWIYLLISALGDVIQIYQPLTRYRIHSNNAVGIRKISYNRFDSSVKNFTKQIEYLGQLLDEKTYPGVWEKIRPFMRLKNERNFFRRLYLVAGLRVRRQNYLDQLIFKMFLLRKAKVN